MELIRYDHYIIAYRNARRKASAKTGLVSSQYVSRRLSLQPVSDSRPNFLCDTTNDFKNAVDSN